MAIVLMADSTRNIVSVIKTLHISLTLTALIILCTLLFLPAMSSAEPYGQGSYSSKCFENCENTISPVSPPDTQVANTQAPNTGLKSENIQLALIAGVIGTVILSMAVVRILSVKRARK